MILFRFIRFIVLVVIFFGVGLSLLGLFGSAWQAASAVYTVLDSFDDVGLEGARVVAAGQSGLAQPAGPTRTPFQPLPPGQPYAAARDEAPGIPRTGQAQATQAAVAQAASDQAAPTQAPEPTATPLPTPTPRPVSAPEGIQIERVGLDASVVIIPRLELVLGQDIFEHWQAPNYFAAGWHEGSAFLGEKGNTVLSGHNNIHGAVFRGLLDLQKGDRLTVTGGGQVYRYEISQVMKFEERDAPLQQRIDNARWILPSDDERLTLVTCWPPESNTYRLIIVAVPVD